MHVAYTEETVWNDDVSRTYTIVERGYTVPLRSNLTLEGLGADIKKSRTGFRERQIFVCIPPIPPPSPPPGRFSVASAASVSCQRES